MNPDMNRDALKSPLSRRLRMPRTPGSVALVASTLLASVFAAPLPADQDRTRAFRKNPPRISCDDTQKELLGKNAPYVKRGDTYIFAGYRQVSAKNQDPVIIRFDRGGRAWCRKDYETGGDDGRAYGLYFDGAHLYAAFSATGTQGSKRGDYRRFTRRGWMKSYGRGGGPRSAVILQLAPNNGKPLSGTFVNSVLKNGKTNSLVVTGMELRGLKLEVQARAWYSPRRPDRKGMTCAGKSPFATTMVFNEDLTRLESVEAERCR